MKRLKVILSVAILISCQSAEIEDARKLYFDIDKAERYLSADSVVNASDCEIFCLEDTERPVSALENILIKDDQIFICDAHSNVINIFAMDGSYKGCLNKRGKAHDEYLDITDFWVQDGNLYILDQSSQKIILYDRDCCFVESIDISDMWGNEIFTFNNSIWLLNSASDTSIGKYHVFRLDEHGGVQNRLFRFDTPLALTAKRSYAIDSDTVLYVERQHNTIYQITDEAVEPMFAADFGKYNMPNELKKLDARGLLQKGVADRYTPGIDNIHVTPSLLLLSFNIGRNVHWAVCDRHGQTVRHLCRGFKGCEPYYLGLFNFVCDGGFVYSFYPADTFRSIYENILSGNGLIPDDAKEKLRVIYDTTDDDSNPIVVKYRLR